MSKSACFTGHRNITSDLNELSAVLYTVLKDLIVNQNITDYYAGGAYGFDAVASNTVLRLRKKYPEVNMNLGIDYVHLLLLLTVCCCIQ